MKKNIITGLIFCILVVCLLGLLISKSDIFPTSGSDFSKIVKRTPPNNSVETKKDKTKTVRQGQTVTNENCEFKVLSAKVSKKLNHLNKVNPVDYVENNVAVDENNTFLDNHLYLEVGLSIKYTGTDTYVFPLSNISLHTIKEGELFSLTDISVTDTTLDASNYDSFHVSFTSGEEKTIYIGYILTEKEYNEIKNNVYILPDLTTNVTSEPELLKKIKLTIKDEWHEKNDAN
ncbi:hypothetical protein IGI37_002724 [Enterococcus sp. AZ194]|uniref:hypothetical protein n=1 Tax=Enterococcus sp. AZ194 TaxID=2774629 RepID=UPI003F20B2BE